MVRSATKYLGGHVGKDGALGANLSYILKARVQLLRDLGSAGGLIPVGAPSPA